MMKKGSALVDSCVEEFCADGVACAGTMKDTLRRQSPDNPGFRTQRATSSEYVRNLSC